ncbi:MAG: paraquat-inducible protein A [Pseudomonadota bacterium]
MDTALRFSNAALLVLYPIAWWAPLMHASVLPIFGGQQISIVSGIATLWSSDIVLALLVALFAVAAPLAKTLALAAIQFRLLGPWAIPTVEHLGRLAMADIFLIALYIVIVKGVSFTRVETAWGLYLFSFCVLGSIVLTEITRRRTGP